MTSQHTVFGETIHRRAKPLEGAMISILDDPKERTMTDERGCFCLSGLKPKNYIVTVSLGADVPLGAVGIHLVERPSGVYSQWPPVANFELPPLSLVQASIHQPEGSQSRISLYYLAGVTVGSEAGSVSVVGSEALSFTDIGPGRYAFGSRFPNGKEVYYPSADSLDEAMVINLGFQPVLLPSWDLSPFLGAGVVVQ